MPEEKVSVPVNPPYQRQVAMPVSPPATDNTPSPPNSERTNWVRLILGNWEGIVACLALLVSFISLVQSIRSTLIAEKSLELSRAEFASQRTVIWQGKPDKENNELLLEAVDKAISLQRAKVAYPFQLNLGLSDVLPPKYGFSLIPLRSKLQSTLQELFPREKDKVLVSLDANVPIVIESNYIAKSEAFVDRSLYALTFSFTLGDDPLRPPSIEFRGLTFLRRMDRNEDPKVILGTTWDEVKRSRKP